MHEAAGTLGKQIANVSGAGSGDVCFPVAGSAVKQNPALGLQRVFFRQLGKPEAEIDDSLDASNDGVQTAKLREIVADVFVKQVF